jgi:hypothetical protein
LYSILTPLISFNPARTVASCGSTIQYKYGQKWVNRACNSTAWWEARLERIDEAALLERLHSEFVNIIEYFDNRRSETLIQEQSKRFYELIEEGQRNNLSEIQVPFRIIGATTSAPTIEVDSPTLDGLIGSGRIELIRVVAV